MTSFLCFVLFIGLPLLELISQTNSMQSPISNDVDQGVNMRSKRDVGESSYFYYQQPHYPRDCKEVYEQCNGDMTESGIFTIQPDGAPEPFEVYCNNSIDGGKWTIFQRRIDGDVDFYRNWMEYKNGFGFLNREFWLGNDKLAYLTNQGDYELRIDFVNKIGDAYHAKFDLFRISDEWTKYRLVDLGQYLPESTAGLNLNLMTSKCTTQEPKSEGNVSCYFVKKSSNVNTLIVQTHCDEGDNSLLKFYESTQIFPELLRSTILTSREDLTQTDLTTDGTTTFKGSMYTPKYKMISTVTIDGTANYRYTTTETTRRIDCVGTIGNTSFQVENGSAYVSSNCTWLATCKDGKIDARQLYCNPYAVCDVRNDGRKCYCIGGYHGDGETCTPLNDCLDVFNAGYTTNGVYTIKPSTWNGSPFNVFCDMREGGGWTVFQRRVNGSVDFYRNWNSYKHGFGELDHEFWLGNDNICFLTNQGNYTLRIDLVNKYGDPYYAEYKLFRIDGEDDFYRMSELGDFNGTAGFDAFRSQLSYSFSTFDNDNDVAGDNCAEKHHGAWWYAQCTVCNLNGHYHAVDDDVTSISWFQLPGSRRNIKYTEMKIRPDV